MVHETETLADATPLPGSELDDMGKLPYFKFYPADWLADVGLRRCSPAARGIAMDIFCLMWQTDERGVLITKKQPWTRQEVARILGGSYWETLRSIKELLTNSVLEIRKDGAIFSKRMVRDEESREEWKGQKRTQRARVRPMSDDAVRQVSGLSSYSYSDTRTGSGAESLKLSKLENNFSSSNTGETTAKKGWVDRDEEARRKTNEVLERRYGRSKEMDVGVPGDVPKKHPAE